MPIEDYFQDDVIDTVDEKVETARPYATTQRSFLGDIGSRTYRGLLDLGELASGISTTITGDTTPGALDKAIKVGRETSFAKPDVDEYLGKESTLKRFVGQAFQAAPVSLAGTAAAIGATALGQPELAMPAAFVVAGSLMGLGTYGQTYKETVNELGEEGARDLALKSSLAELGSELPSTLLTVGAGGALFKSAAGALKKQGLDVTIKNMTKALSNKVAIKQLLKTGAEIGTLEVGGEALGSYYQANELNKAHGRVIVDPMDAAIDAAGTAAVMSLMMISASSGMSSINRSKLKSALTSDDKVLRKAASDVISKNLTDPAIRDSWDNYSQKIINTPGAKFTLDDKFIKLGEALKVEEAKPITNQEILDPENSGELQSKVDLQLKSANQELVTSEQLFGTGPVGVKTTRTTPVASLARTASDKRVASIKVESDKKLKAIREFDKQLAAQAPDAPPSLKLKNLRKSIDTFSKGLTETKDKAKVLNIRRQLNNSIKRAESGERVEVSNAAFDRHVAGINAVAQQGRSVQAIEANAQAFIKEGIAAQKKADEATVTSLTEKVASGQDLTNQELIDFQQAKFGKEAPTKDIAQKPIDSLFEGTVSETPKEDIKAAIANVSTSTTFETGAIPDATGKASALGQAPSKGTRSLDSGNSKAVPGSKFVFTQGEENTDRSNFIVGIHPTSKQGIELQKITKMGGGSEWAVVITEGSKGRIKETLGTFKYLADAKKAAVESIEGPVTSRKGKKSITTLAKGEVGGGTAPLDIAKGIIKVGMKIGEFAKAMRKALGKGYNKIRRQIRSLFEKAQKHLSKITTGAQVGAIGDKAIKAPKQAVAQQVKVEATVAPVAASEAVEAKLKPDVKEKKEYTPEEYKAYVKEEIAKNARPEELSEVVKDKYSSFIKDSKRIFKNSFQTIDAGVHNISRTLHGSLKRGETVRTTLHKKWSDASLPFVKEVNKLPNKIQNELFFGLRNGENDKFGAYDSALDILNDPNNKELKRTYAKFRKEVIEDAEKRLVKTGRLTEIIPGWFPSKAKDPMALFMKLDSGIKSKFDKQLDEEAKRRRKKNLPFTDGDRADFIAALISSNRFNAIRQPGNIRERTIDHVSPTLVHLYEDIPTTIAAYIGEISEDLAISEMVGRSNRAVTVRSLNELRKKVEKGEATPAQFNKLAGTLKTIEEDRENSLASVINSDSTLTPEQKEEVSLLFKARFNQRGTRGAVQTFKNFSLMSTIGSVFSAITQLGDPIFNIYKHGKFAPESMWGAMVNPNKISKFFDFESVMREFTPSKVGSAPALDFMLKWSGLRTLDLFGKESFLQGAQAKWSKEPLERFTKKFGDMFPGKDMAELQKKLKSEEYTDEDVQTILFSALGEVQPVSISDAPVYFATGGNLRILYMLKLFAIKSINLTVTEFTDEWSKGTPKAKSMAVMKAVSLLGMLTLAGAGTDELKDIILNRNTETALSDKMFANLLQLGMLNQYSIDKGLKSGNLIESILSNNLPATRFPSQVITDIFKTVSGEPSYKSLAGLPLGGKLLYEGAFGIGGTKQGKEAEIKRVRKQITKDIDDAIDNGVSSQLRNNVSTFNKDARKFNLSTIAISKLLKAARRRKVADDKGK